jgi:transposase
MPLKNRYYKCSKISERKFREIIRYFARDLTASDTSRLTSISTRSINNIYLKLRKRILQVCEQHTPLKGVIEIDESYFGPHRIRGKRGRGAGGKTIVFGIFKRGDKVYTEIVPDASKASLIKVIRGHVSIDSIIHTDGWRGYNGLVDVGFAKHYRVRHGENEFANDNQHINGIESFWSYAKRRLVKFNGVPRSSFLLHLKETEFRFNYRNKNLYKVLLKLLRNEPLS